MLTPVSFDVTVKDSAGAYQTNTVRGLRASSTSGPEGAARRLADKLCGTSFDKLECVYHVPGLSRWSLHATPFYAWCWATGLIEIGREVPKDAIPFATGLSPALADCLCAVARHSKGGKGGQLLVPGVPEAPDQLRAMDALIAWVEECEKRNKRTGVQFSRCLGVRQ